MQSSPEADELLQSVSFFLRNKILPKLSGRDAYDIRVAANVLNIVERELRLRQRAETEEALRLATLPGIRQDALHAMNLQLCEGIACGDFGPHTPGLTEHLWATTLSTLAVDQPEYSSYQAALRSGANHEL
ncbi:hypothetical protein FWJ25_14220 [Marinobacter salinexigens]|uniref:DUF6285 domain-containing protein n=1 Tax=Marinobacter salinexigens TaxID=2919747 RepID=A0A5B0VD19_9GAMM|nr:DUF6285 domain-containing protein [Marinobacter salinexigens]KAA1172344.1 hypothetical protein FWJ25_14220 [Marinobacter salinexigens]